MARSFSTATLTVKLQESIVLGGQNMGSINSYSIPGVKNIVKRYMTATTTEANIIKFATVEAAGQFIAANVRYLRVTNLDDTNFCYLVFKNEYSNEFCVKLDKGKSFIYNADASSGLVDTMLANQVALGFTEASGDVGTGDSFIDNITANGAIIPGLRVSHDSGYMPTGTSVGAITNTANGVSAATSHTTVTRNATTGATTVSEGTGTDSDIELYIATT